MTQEKRGESDRRADERRKSENPIPPTEEERRESQRRQTDRRKSGE